MKVDAKSTIEGGVSYSWHRIWLDQNKSCLDR